MEQYQKPSSSNIQDSSHNSGVKRFINQMHSLRTMQMFGAIGQIVLGLSVIVASVMGLIQPLWLAGFFIAIASVVTIIGSYLVYIIRSKSHNYNSLKRNAVRRVMKSKN